MAAGEQQEEGAGRGETESKSATPSTQQPFRGMPPPSSLYAPSSLHSAHAHGPVIKGPLYRQQQKKEKEARIARAMENSRRAQGLIVDNEATRAEEAERQAEAERALAASTAASQRRKRLNASTEIEHCSMAARHTTVRVNMRPTKNYHR